MDLLFFRNCSYIFDEKWLKIIYRITGNGISWHMSRGMEKEARRQIKD
jgi:hypothetical protein